MLKDFTMVASHSRRAASGDAIFKVNGEAQMAAKQYGKDKIVNASVGALLDDAGKLVVLPTVVDILRNLDGEDFAAYAPIAGLPQFLEAAKKAAFRDCTPKGHIGAVATPGGTGAIRHAIWNYSEFGDTVLTADWFWGPYKTIAEEHGRRLDTFKLFDENYNFNLPSFQEKVGEILKSQKRIVILLNSPANNPTGYSLAEGEWAGVLNTLKEYAEDKDNRVIIFVDIAYIDYAGEGNEARRFFTKFGDLPENILTIVAFSMSKGYTLYGMRCGAMIGISSNEEIAKEFSQVNEFSNRGVWSNGTRPAMVTLAKIMNDKSLFDKVEGEREVFRRMLNDRAKAFVEEAGKVNLPICPYKSGFFISVPCENSSQVTDRLKEYNVFAVPIQKGIRFAVCSVSEDKCRLVPESMAKALGI